MRPTRPGSGRTAGTVVAHVSATNTLGGVAEVVRGELAELHRRGIRTSWQVVRTDPRTPVNQVGLALHRALYAAADCAEVDRAHLDGPAVSAELTSYGAAEADRLAAGVRGADLLVLHDPLCLPLARWLRPLVGTVLWRCHVGDGRRSAEAEAAAALLEPFLDEVDVLSFLRAEYAWPSLAGRRVVPVPPGINPDGPKNADLPTDVVARLAAPLLTAGTLPDSPDGAVLDHHGTGFLVTAGAPYLLQVARWDPLKGQSGLVRTFATVAGAHPDCALVLLGPHIDPARHYPEDVAELRALLGARMRLPEPVRRRVHVWTFPPCSGELEAVTVNVLQRSATVVAQNSMREGFGLTVAEAMWKRRAVVATAVGGIPDQITEGVSGLLAVPGRTGTGANQALGRQLGRALADPALRRRLGGTARQVIASRFLVSHAVDRQLAALGAPAAPTVPAIPSLPAIPPVPAIPSLPARPAVARPAAGSPSRGVPHHLPEVSR